MHMRTVGSTCLPNRTNLQVSAPQAHVGRNSDRVSEAGPSSP